MSISKKLKGALGAIFAFVMALVIATPAMAAVTTPVLETTKGSFEVKNLEERTVVTAYKIIDVNWQNIDTDGDGQVNNGQPVEPMYEWASENLIWWILGSDYSAYADSNSIKVTDSYLLDKDGITTNADKEKLAGFVDALSAELARQGTTVALAPTQQTVATGATSVTFSNMDMGEYLVVISNSQNYVYRPSTVNLTPKYDDDDSAWKLEDATVEIKRSPVWVDKSITGPNGPVDVIGANIGDTLSFTALAPVPSYPDDAVSKAMIIADAPAKGITISEENINGIKVYGMNTASKDPNDGGVEIKNAYELVDKYSYDTQDSQGNVTKVTVNKVNADGSTNFTFALDFDYEKVKEYNYILVTYDGTLNADAEMIEGANPNEISYIYDPNPYNEGGFTKKDDKTYTYTWGIEVFKYDGDSGNAQTALPGAEFTLSRNGANTAIEFVDLGNGAYRVATKDDAKTTTTIVSNANGKIDLKGLNEGEYVLTETKAPAGFTLPAENATAVKIVSAKDAAGNPTQAIDSSLSTVQGKIGYVATNVANYTTPELPSTGGAGTVAITVAGVALMAGAVVFLARSRKQN